MDTPDTPFVATLKTAFTERSRLPERCAIRFCQNSVSGQNSISPCEHKEICLCLVRTVFPRLCPRGNTEPRWVIGHSSVVIADGVSTEERPIKQRYYPMFGFQNLESASRFCSAFDELRNYLRVSSVVDEPIPASNRREIFTGRWSALMTELAA